MDAEHNRKENTRFTFHPHYALDFLDELMILPLTEYSALNLFISWRKDYFILFNRWEADLDIFIRVPVSSRVVSIFCSNNLTGESQNAFSDHHDLQDNKSLQCLPQREEIFISFLCRRQERNFGKEEKSYC